MAKSSTKTTHYTTTEALYHEIKQLLLAKIRIPGYDYIVSQDGKVGHIQDMPRFADGGGMLMPRDMLDDDNYRAEVSHFISAPLTKVIAKAADKRITSLTQEKAHRYRNTFADLLLAMWKDPLTSQRTKEKFEAVVRAQTLLFVPFQEQAQLDSFADNPYAFGHFLGGYMPHNNIFAILLHANPTPEEIALFKESFRHEAEHMVNDDEIRGVGCPESRAHQSNPSMVLPPIRTDAESISKLLSAIEKDEKALLQLHDLWVANAPKDRPMLKEVGDLLRTSPRYAPYIQDLPTYYSQSSVSPNEPAQRSALKELVKEYQERAWKVRRFYSDDLLIEIAEWVGYMEELDLSPKAKKRLLPATYALHQATATCTENFLAFTHAHQAMAHAMPIKQGGRVYGKHSAAEPLPFSYSPALAGMMMVAAASSAIPDDKEDAAAIITSLMMLTALLYLLCRGVKGCFSGKIAQEREASFYPSTRSK